MPRTYSEKFLRELSNNENLHNDLGIELAKICVRANLPMAYIAKVLGVTKLTVFHWFRGRQVRDVRRRTVLRFITVVERDLANGVLPARSTIEAKRYIEVLTKPETVTPEAADTNNQ